MMQESIASSPGTATPIPPQNGLEPVPFIFRQGDITFEVFLDLIPDGQKADLVDGVIYVASPDNTMAGELLTWLTTLVGLFVEQKDLGKVYISRIAFRIGPNRGPEPDLSYLPKDCERNRQRGFINGPPALAVEIVSPDSVARDYVQKRAIYEQAGVTEYWILDPDEERATFLTLREGRYEEVKPVNHIFVSSVLPGFQLDVRWLWSQSRPRAYDVLQQLLGK